VYRGFPVVAAAPVALQVIADAIVGSTVATEALADVMSVGPYFKSKVAPAAALLVTRII
jgi:hypothetical protein